MRRLLLLAFAAALRAQAIALTLDDGPTLRETPLLTPAQRNEALLRHLRTAGVPAAFFVTSGNGADRPEGFALLKALSEGGQLIANHTATHPDFNAEGTTLEAFEADLLACDRVIAPLAGFRKWLRFPYLREGATAAKRDGIRAFLQARGIRIGYVSVDTADWLIDEKLRAKLAKDPAADLAPWRALYLAHLEARVRCYDALAKGLYGRPVPHTLLLHHNLLNALFLGDALAHFRKLGWTLISPDEAFADPAYAVLPQFLPLDGSVLETTAEALGLPLKPYFKGFQSERAVGEAAGRL